MVTSDTQGGPPVSQTPPPMVGRDPSIRLALSAAAGAALAAGPILLCGEQGTGKRLLARSIHAISERADGAFVAVTCGGVPAGVVERELLGGGRYRRALGGTLFLDEVTGLSAPLQSWLQRLLVRQERSAIGEPGEASRAPTGARVIASTERDLRAEVAAKRFREDLYYRLGVVTVFLPPLRARVGDIPELAVHFIERFARQHGRGSEGLDEEAVALLKKHRWPGNVRELRSAIERAVLVADGPRIGVEHLPPGLDAPDPGPADPEASASDREPLLTLREIERGHINRVLELTGGRITRAAEILSIHRNTLRRKLRLHGLLPSMTGGTASVLER